MSEPAEVETADATRARARGDLPRAQGYTALLTVLGGVCALQAALVAATDVPNALQAVATTAFERFDPVATLAAARPLAWALVVAPAVGALAGLVLAQVTLGAVSLRLRGRLRPGSAPGFGLAGPLLACVGGPIAALWVLPTTLPAPDAGYVVLRAAPVVLFATAGVLLPFALLQRSRARTAWTERVAPDPPPRRDPDEPPPEARAALRQAAAEATPTPSPPSAP